MDKEKKKKMCLSSCLCMMQVEEGGEGGGDGGCIGGDGLGGGKEGREKGGKGRGAVIRDSVVVFMQREAVRKERNHLQIFFFTCEKQNQIKCVKCCNKKNKWLTKVNKTIYLEFTAA